MKNEILITFLNDYINGSEDNYKIKAEYSTNDSDIKVIVAQETSGTRQVFYGDIEPLYNYFNIEIFGDSIEDEYKTAKLIGDLIGSTHYVDIEGTNGHHDIWEIIFKQYTNPRTIQYYDIRRVSYTLTLQVVISKIGESEEEELT